MDYENLPNELKGLTKEQIENFLDCFKLTVEICDENREQLEVLKKERQLKKKPKNLDESKQ